MSPLKTAGLILLTGLVVLLISLYIATASTAHAHSYRVVAAERYNHPEKMRVGWHIIAPNAISAEDRAATIRNAAQQLFVETGADEVIIWLQPDERVIGSGLVLAKIEANPDSSKFTITASDSVFSAQDIEIFIAIKSLHPQFIRNNILDDAGLYREVRTRFGLSDSHIFPLPPLQREISVYKIETIGGKDPASVQNPSSFLR